MAMDMASSPSASWWWASASASLLMVLMPLLVMMLLILLLLLPCAFPSSSLRRYLLPVRACVCVSCIYVEVWRACFRFLVRGWSWSVYGCVCSAEDADTDGGNPCEYSHCGPSLVSHTWERCGREASVGGRDRRRWWW